MTDPNSIKPQKPISSEEIKRNFRGEKKERHLGLKLLVGFGVVAVLFFIYHFVKTPADAGQSGPAPVLVKPMETIPNSGDSNLKTPNAVSKPVDNGSKQTIQLPPLTVPGNGPAKPKRLFLSVRGNSLNNLREKLKMASEKIMSQGNVRPVNASLNINSLSFRCDFEEVDPLERVKLLSLLWGPLPQGCESCGNALNQNPGSEVLIRKTDNAFDYKVLSIR